ncbi:MAG: hypothetical protein AAB875_00815 [Patescibacteria group bacterium]
MKSNMMGWNKQYINGLILNVKTADQHALSSSILRDVMYILNTLEKEGSFLLEDRSARIAERKTLKSSRTIRVDPNIFAVGDVVDVVLVESSNIRCPKCWYLFSARAMPAGKYPCRCPAVDCHHEFSIVVDLDKKVSYIEKGAS